MPRPPRIDIPGLVYHVTGRGVKKLPIFHDDEDRHRFLRLLARARQQHPFRLHAYCLMANHYHLLLQTIEDSLSRTMQYFKSLFAQTFNWKNAQVGHVFQGRFHSIPVQTDAYMMTVCRYIHLNPVRAGLVKRPEEYPWSNYRRLISGEPDPLVDGNDVLSYFGPDPTRQIADYQRFVEDGIMRQEEVTEKVLYRMRFWGRPPAEVALPI